MPDSDLSDDADPRLLPTLKEYALFMPVIGGALAVSFDVGFFYGLQSGFFTAFSLSEHLVSALYATPLALVVLALGVLELVILMRLKPKALRVRSAFGSFLIGAVAVPAIAAYVKADYLIAGAFAVILLAMLLFFFAKTKYQWQLALLLAMPIVGLCLSFMLGVSWSEGMLKETEKHSRIEMTAGDPIVGTVIRTGERGVLLFADKGFILIPWTNIRSVRNQFQN